MQKKEKLPSFNIFNFALIKSKSQKSYRKRLNTIRNYLKNQPVENKAPSIFKKLTLLIDHKELEVWNSHNVYWLHLLEDLFYLQEILEDYSQRKRESSSSILKAPPKKNSKQSIIFSLEEEELFDYWCESEYADEFLSLLQEKKSLLAVVKIFQKKLEYQTLSFFYLHISPTVITIFQTRKFFYRSIPEIGDNEFGIFLTAKEYFSQFPKKLPRRSYDIEWKNINLQKGTLVCLIPFKGKLVIERESSFKTSIFLEDFKQKLDHSISVLSPPSPKIRKHIELCHLALKIISIASRKSFESFCSFTHTIIPINEKGVVSYSTPKLPGYSCINFFERDFIDLIDDLIHENGHHHLNYCLSFDKLIYDDDEKIYFSPWRRALRPIRGIYHALFTFFMGLQLFRDLIINFDNTELNKIYQFSKKEKSKIILRFLEEFLMISFCKRDLDKAFNERKITARGKVLINNIYENLDDQETLFNNLMLCLKKSHKANYKKIISLKANLEKKLNHYSLT